VKDIVCSSFSRFKFPYIELKIFEEEFNIILLLITLHVLQYIPTLSKLLTTSQYNKIAYIIPDLF
jgi:hypothetical protein